MDDKLSELTDRLRKAHGDALLSVILYGSAAAGDPNDKFSDLNVLCVLRQVTPAELAASEPIFKWWRDQGHPVPLLLSEEEVRTSTDCFPIEFEDMRARRRVLFGSDPIESLIIDKIFYRAQVEHDLRAKLLRLRQKAAGVLGNKKALLDLMLDSVSTFCVLGRHALLLSGFPVGWQRRDAVNKLAEAGLESSALATLLDIREKKKKAADVDAAELFKTYLKQIEAIVSYVDRLEK